jgi:hypothetical protein
VNKSTQLVLRFKKSTDAFWSQVLTVADEKAVQEEADTVTARIRVKSYNLIDFQFIQVKLDINKGNEMVMLVPRSIVLTVAEGDASLVDAFSFAGTKV